MKESLPAENALDAVSPLSRIALLKTLGLATTELKSAQTPIARIQAGKAVAAALAALGLAADTADDAPGVERDDDGMSDDPASANYRYRDTGYIANSRKELAANMIRVARGNGQSVRATDIDWKAIEQNPRQAAELIVKANLFGKTDWQALRDAGMDPAAGFLIEKIYASIGTEPTSTLPKVVVQALSGGLSGAAALSSSGVLDRDSADAVAQTRKDFAVGLETIRDRLQVCRTVDDVMGVIAEIRDELTGVTLSAAQADAVSALERQYQEKMQYAKDEKAKYTALFSAFRSLQAERDGFASEQAKRTNRGWKPDPEIDTKIAELEPRIEAAEEVFRDYQGKHPELQNQKRTYENGGFNYLNDLEYAAETVRRQIGVIRNQAKYFNLLSNPATRSWLSFGERFFKLLNYRSARGSDAFGAHVTSARMGRITDWSWADKERPTNTGRKPTGEEINFQLVVAESYVRTGGRSVPVDSTLALKELLGLQDVQSGNWVLRDQASAKFHVEQTAAAMSDMADVLGIDMKHLGLGGRLSMAFGARGRGGKGAARAHYEPVQRVINLTKMGGGGSLGHELFHAFDNILPSLARGTAGGKGEFATMDPGLMPKGPLSDAFANLRRAMLEGSKNLIEIIKLAPGDKATAERNIDSSYPNQVAKAIKAAGGAEAAVMAVDRIYAGREDRKSMTNRKRWRTLAAAYYTDAGVESVKLAVGRPGSDFAFEAQLLDDGQSGKYWSQVEELAARAFQGYLEDTLKASGRRNDYLSFGGDNTHYDGAKPFPEGVERERINAAFAQLFSVLKEDGVFVRASSDAALLDAIFGPVPSRAGAVLDLMLSSDDPCSVLDAALDAVGDAGRGELLADIARAQAELQSAASPLAKIRAAQALAMALQENANTPLRAANASGIVPETGDSPDAGAGDMDSKLTKTQLGALISAADHGSPFRYLGSDGKVDSRPATPSFSVMVERLQASGYLLGWKITEKGLAAIGRSPDTGSASGQDAGESVAAASGSLVDEAKAIESAIAGHFTGLDSKRLARAVASYTSGYTTQVAKKDATNDIGRLYEQVKDEIQALYLGTPEEERTELQGEVYFDMPMYANNWRQKHADKVLAAFPGEGSRLEVIAKIMRLREIVSSGEVVKVASKAQVQREKAAAAMGSADPSINDLVAKLQLLKPGLASDFEKFVTEALNHLLEKYGPGEKLSDIGNSGSADGYTYRQFNRFYTTKGLGWSDRAVTGLNADAITLAAKRYAEDQITAFTAKLLTKIGNLTDVTVHDLSAGNFTFTITGNLGERKVLVEQSRIINQSVNGLVFHQWPARIYVDKKFHSELAYRALSTGVA